MHNLVLLALLGFSQIAKSSYSASYTFDEITPSRVLTWFPCNDGFFCAKLSVPLDYQRPSLGQASVPLVKYSATANSSDGAYQGIMLLNPGGPGASGISETLTGGPLIQAVAGSNWDIVGFDPRGMWLSEPLANCSSITSSGTPALRSRTVPKVSDSFYNGFIDSGKELGILCQETIGGEKDAGPHMSTAVTARDMLSIVDAFSKTADGKRAAKPRNLLNYYGISYGTFLGQTFASMFPDRVGNVVLDGIVSPTSYLSDYTSNAVTHLDGIIATFFIYCHVLGPAKCSYYTGSTPKDIYNRFNASFIQLDPRKAEFENWTNATDLEAALLGLKIALLTTADTPLSYFSLLPSVLLDLETAISNQNITAWTETLTPIFGYTNTPADEWSLGVLCSDQNNSLYNKTLEDLQSRISELEKDSIVGEIWIKSVLGCTGWSIKASEIFEGPFVGETKTPILFVSNTFDPVTPIQNSMTSAPNYQGAEVLVIDGMGHTIRATQNPCGYAKIRAYFQYTQMPGNNSYCPLETAPFGIVLNGTLKENIEQAGLASLVD